LNTVKEKRLVPHITRGFDLAYVAVQAIGTAPKIGLSDMRFKVLGSNPQPVPT
jgi:hypothetical protein